MFDIPWNDELTYGDVRHREEVEHSAYSFDEADVGFFSDLFDRWENEATRLLGDREPAEDGAARPPIVLPAYEAVLKCSHLFNVLDARGACSVTERAAYIRRIRRQACRCAEAWLEQRRVAGYPLLDRSAPDRRGEGGS